MSEPYKTELKSCVPRKTLKLKKKHVTPCKPSKSGCRKYNQDKNIHSTIYFVKDLWLCLSVTNLNYFRTGWKEWAEICLAHLCQNFTSICFPSQGAGRGQGQGPTNTPISCNVHIPLITLLGGAQWFKITAYFWIFFCSFYFNVKTSWGK